MPMTIDAKNEIDHGAKDIAAVGWGLFCILMPLGNTTLSILVFWLALMATARSPASRRALVRAVRTNRLMQATLFFVFTLFASAVFSAHRTLALLGACGYGMIALSPLLVGLLWHMPSADWLLRRGTLWLSLGGLISDQSSSTGRAPRSGHQRQPEDEDRERGVSERHQNAKQAPSYRRNVFCPMIDLVFRVYSHWHNDRISSGILSFCRSRSTVRTRIRISVPNDRSSTYLSCKRILVGLISSR
jgi:hypothetical protein